MENPFCIEKLSALYTIKLIIPGSLLPTQLKSEFVLGDFFFMELVLLVIKNQQSKKY